MAFARINNNVHHYVSLGAKSKPALLFANSLGTDLRIWDDVTNCLDENFRVVRYDKRGHGLSDVPPSPYSINDLARKISDWTGRRWMVVVSARENSCRRASRSPSLRPLPACSMLSKSIRRCCAVYP